MPSGPRRSPGAQLLGVALAVGAAVGFGLVSVVAKRSLLDPLQTAGYAYALAGAVLAPTLLRVRVGRADWPKILAMSLVGGAIAPALLFFGLQRTGASVASLLLTLELVFTAILARVFLRERIGGRGAFGLALLLAAAVAVGATTAGAGGTTVVGAALVAVATLGWGIDNTVSARLVGSYAPHHLIALKGLIGGGALLVAAVAWDRGLASPLADARAVIFIGLFGACLSTVLFYGALQRIGPTRTTGIFIPATALAGVLGAALFLREPLGWIHAVAFAMIGAGVWLVTRRSGHATTDRA